MFGSLSSFVCSSANETVAAETDNEAREELLG